MFYLVMGVRVGVANFFWINLGVRVGEAKFFLDQLYRCHIATVRLDEINGIDETNTFQLKFFKYWRDQYISVKIFYDDTNTFQLKFFI